jgi:hypothetical protein
MFSIPGHKGNANQNDAEISRHFHPSQNDYKEKHYQMLVKMQRRKEP